MYKICIADEEISIYDRPGGSETGNKIAPDTVFAITGREEVDGVDWPIVGWNQETFGVIQADVQVFILEERWVKGVTHKLKAAADLESRTLRILEDGEQVYSRGLDGGFYKVVTTKNEVGYIPQYGIVDTLVDHSYDAPFGTFQVRARSVAFAVFIAATFFFGLGGFEKIRDFFDDGNEFHISDYFGSKCGKVESREAECNACENRPNMVYSFSSRLCNYDQEICERERNDPSADQGCARNDWERISKSIRVSDFEEHTTRFHHSPYFDKAKRNQAKSTQIQCMSAASEAFEKWTVSRDTFRGSFTLFYPVYLKCRDYDLRSLDLNQEFLEAYDSALKTEAQAQCVSEAKGVYRRWSVHRSAHPGAGLFERMHDLCGDAKSLTYLVRQGQVSSGFLQKYSDFSK